jgi:hypothetical protein
VKNNNQLATEVGGEVSGSGGGSDGGDDYGGSGKIDGGGKFGGTISCWAYQAKIEEEQQIKIVLFVSKN